MRTTWPTSTTKILPSPILPVRAAFTIASIAFSTSESATTTSTFTFRGNEADVAYASNQGFTLRLHAVASD